MSNELTKLAKLSFFTVNICLAILGLSVGVFLVTMLGKFYLLNTDTAVSFVAATFIGLLLFRMVIVNQDLLQHLIAFGSVQKKALKKNLEPETVIGSIIISDSEIRYYFFLMTTRISVILLLFALLISSFVFWSTSLLIVKIICSFLITVCVSGAFIFSASKLVNKKFFKVPDDFEVDLQRQHDVFFELDRSTQKFSNIFK